MTKFYSGKTKHHLIGWFKKDRCINGNQPSQQHSSIIRAAARFTTCYLLGDGINFVHQIQRVRPFFLWTDESKLSSCPGFLTSTVERVLVHALPPFPAVYGKQRMILSLFVCVFTFDLL
jgi:hypothetical protein